MVIISMLSLTIYLLSPRYTPSQSFDGERAYADVIYQIDLGPRTVGSDAHASIVSWLQEELDRNGWEVSVQDSTRLGVRVQNIIGKRGTGDEWIILGAHYDSRSAADQDSEPSERSKPVPGANDGASGVAVLLELSRVLSEKLEKQIWLVFIDAEDNGNIQGQDWIIGSREFVDKLEGTPNAAVIIDMIGDADLKVYWERNSDPTLLQAIWGTANELGYSDIFIPEYKYRIIDDHIPFLRAGIPAVDIIDFDYPYWHTTEDTADKVSPDSLAIIGNTLLHWLENADNK
jgi:Zn-dependent M28 family amino/carboxypeptidase